MADKTIQDKVIFDSSGQRIIQGRVADIVSDREVVLNVGLRDGVKRKMRFAILNEIDYEVKDPITGEVLGTFPPLEKVRVEAVNVLEKMSIARTYQVRRINVGGKSYAFPSLSRRLEPARYVDQPITFGVDEQYHPIYLQIPPEKSIVKIGDLVRQVLDDD